MQVNKKKRLEIDTSLPLESLFNLILNHALSSIDAQAGSLMIVYPKRGILRIRSRLGIPKKGRKGEPEYPINGNSIASQAVRLKKPVLVNNLSKAAQSEYVASRSENKIQSLLSVPIIHNDGVIAVINADSEVKDFFNKNNQSVLIGISHEVAPIIAERISFLEALKEVSIELSKSPAEGEVDKVLQKITDVAVRSLGIDIVTLYEYDEAKDEFIVGTTGPKVGGLLADKTKMRANVRKEDVPYQVLTMRKEPLFIKDVTKEHFISKRMKRPDGRARFIEREKIKSMAAFLLPNRAYDNPNEEIVGVLFANYKKTHDFNVDEQDALATFADYAATAILTSRKERHRREEARTLESAKTAEQLKSVLDTIVTAVTGNFDQNTVFENILETTMDILLAEACSIYFEDVENQPGVFKCIAGAGFAGNIVNVATYELGEGLTGTIARDGEAIIIKTDEDLNTYKSKNQWKGKFDQRQWASKSKFENLIGVPIRLGNKIIGVIKAENKMGDKRTAFTNNDLENLKIIGTVIGLTMENLRLQNKIEQQLKSISAQAAHRINNQIANYAAIELDLRNELSGDFIIRENIQIAADDILKSTESIKELVTEIKEFGKPLRLNLKICSLTKIIEDEVWLAAEKKIDEHRNIKIHTSKLADDIPYFLIDPTHFSESMKEILKNAKKAILRHQAQQKNRPIEGRIEISTQKLIIDNKEFARILIEDNGPGFPEGIPVLEPYTTTDTDSTGLGLATVNEVIEKHGGKIELKSSYMNGACLEILMPIKTQK